MIIHLRHSHRVHFRAKSGSPIHQRVQRNPIDLLAAVRLNITFIFLRSESAFKTCSAACVSAISVHVDYLVDYFVTGKHKRGFTYLYGRLYIVKAL